MKKIFLSLAVIGLTIAGVAGATVAYYNSSASVLGSTFSAGAMNLKIDANPSPSFYNWQSTFPAPAGFPVGSTNLMPGSHGEQIIDIKNEGLVPGYATIKFDATLWSALGDNLNITVYYDGDHNGTFDASPIASGTLAAWNHNTYTLGAMTGVTDDPAYPGYLASVKIEWSVPTSAGNDIQGKSVVIDTTFGLEQTH